MLLNANFLSAPVIISAYRKTLFAAESSAGIKWMRIRLGALSVSTAGTILPHKAAAPSLTFSSAPESFSPDFTVIPLDPLSAGFFAVAAVRWEEAETGAGILIARTYQLSSGRLAERK